MVELLIATAMGLVVIGGAVSIFVSGVRSEPRTSSKVAAIQQGRTAMERIVRELRQGIEVPSASPSQLSVVTYVDEATCGGSPASTAIPCRVTYSCSAGACTRAVADPDGSSPGSPVQVVTGLSDTNVFTYTAPDYVGVRLAFEAREAADPVTLSDGAFLRNPDSGS